MLKKEIKGAGCAKGEDKMCKGRKDYGGKSEARELRRKIKG